MRQVIAQPDLVRVGLLPRQITGNCAGPSAVAHRTVAQRRRERAVHPVDAVQRRGEGVAVVGFATGVIGIEAACPFGTAEVAVLRNGRHLEAIGRLDHQRDATRLGIGVTQGAARIGVADVAVLLGIVPRETNADGFRNRNVHAALHLNKVAFASTDGAIDRENIARLGGFVKHRAARGVTPKQGALRPLENLYRTKVEKRGRRVASRKRRFVNVSQHGGAGAGERVKRLAAKREANLVGILAALDDQARHQGSQILFAGDIALEQGVGIESRNRYGNL